MLCDVTGIFVFCIRVNQFLDKEKVVIERVSDTYEILNDVLNNLTSRRDDLADIVKLLIDEHGNEKLAYSGGAPIDDAAYKYSVNIMESFDNVIDEFETSFRTICLLLPYIAMKTVEEKHMINLDNFPG